MTESPIWLMLAFPGDDTGRYALRAFAPSKSGKCWYRRLKTREAAIACKRELVEAGIPYVCKKVDAASQQDRAPSKPRSNVVRFPATSREGFGGKLNAKPIDGSWRRKKRRS
jgi:hypothetical protein